VGNYGLTLLFTFDILLQFQTIYLLGPDGADGGHGAHVIFTADSRVRCLFDYIVPVFFGDISAYVFGFVAFSSIMFIITIDLGK